MISIYHRRVGIYLKRINKEAYNRLITLQEPFSTLTTMLFHLYPNFMFTCHKIQNTTIFF